MLSCVCSSCPQQSTISPVVNPEQRLSIREAVELIAQHGEKPISESALRSRAKTKRLGVSRVNGRIYTNPLNLASAGLIPIGVVTATVVPKAIDDDELHAWLDAPSGDRPLDTPGPLERLLEQGPDVEPPASGERERSRELGVPERPKSERRPESEPRSGDDVDETLDEFLGEQPHATNPPRWPEGRDESELQEPQRPTGGEAPIEGSGPAPSGAASREALAPVPPTRRAPASRNLRLVAAAALATVIAMIVATTLPADESSAPPAPEASENAATATQLEQRRRAAAITDADQRGDYDSVMRLASFSGDQAAYDAAKSDATRALLSRARKALEDDKTKTARRYVRRAEKRYGDPDPTARRNVEARIRRAERSLRRARDKADRARRAQRALAAARRAAPIATPAPQPAATPAPQRTTPAPATSSSNGSAAPSTPTPKSQKPAPSSSGRTSDARDPEFY